MERAFLVTDNLAFEVLNDERFGGKYVLVTDCMKETQRAQFVDVMKKPMEKISSFGDAGRQADLQNAVSTNWWLVLEELYGEVFHS